DGEVRRVTVEPPAVVRLLVAEMEPLPLGVRHAAFRLAEEVDICGTSESELLRDVLEVLAVLVLLRVQFDAEPVEGDVARLRDGRAEIEGALTAGLPVLEDVIADLDRRWAIELARRERRVRIPGRRRGDRLERRAGWHRFR